MSAWVRLKNLRWGTTQQYVLAFFAQLDMCFLIAEGEGVVNLFTHPCCSSMTALVKVKSRLDADVVANTLDGQKVMGQYVRVSVDDGQTACCSAMGMEEPEEKVTKLRFNLEELTKATLDRELMACGEPARTLLQEGWTLW